MYFIIIVLVENVNEDNMAGGHDVIQRNLHRDYFISTNKMNKIY